MTYYWTNDWNDQGTAMAEDAQLNWAATEHEAKEAALADMAESCGELEPGERIVVDAIGEDDCWSKMPREWSEHEIEEHAYSCGIALDDFTVRREHPGLGHKVWVSVTAPVFGARVEIADD